MAMRATITHHNGVVETLELDPAEVLAQGDGKSKVRFSARRAAAYSMLAVTSDVELTCNQDLLSISNAQDLASELVIDFTLRKFEELARQELPDEEV